MWNARAVGEQPRYSSNYYISVLPYNGGFCHDCLHHETVFACITKVLYTAKTKYRNFETNIPIFLAVAGVPGVAGFFGVAGFLAVASIPADPEIPIIAGISLHTVLHNEHF